MRYSKFDPNSPRAQRGIKFQEYVLDDLRNAGMMATPIREWLQRVSPEITESAMNKQEKMLGDIVIVSPSDGSLVFVECCSMLEGKETRFPASKTENFNGILRWYALGWDGIDNVVFARSESWNRYVNKTTRDGAYYVFPAKYITTFNAAERGAKDFAKCL